MAGGEPLLRALYERDGEPAVRVGDTALTYAQLRDAAGAVARRAAGAERVAVWAESSI
jgi:malonyl-CoA/methylmalonyl-CoA synthetase